MVFIVAVAQIDSHCANSEDSVIPPIVLVVAPVLGRDGLMVEGGNQHVVTYGHLQRLVRIGTPAGYRYAICQITLSQSNSSIAAGKRIFDCHGLTDRTSSIWTLQHKFVKTSLSVTGHSHRGPPFGRRGSVVDNDSDRGCGKRGVDTVRGGIESRVIGEGVVPSDCGQCKGPGIGGSIRRLLVDVYAEGAGEVGGLAYGYG